MSAKIRVLLTLSALLIVSLACATLTGGQTEPTPTLPPPNTLPPLPTNTEAPPQPTEAPAQPTEAPAQPTELPPAGNGILPLQGGEVLFSDDFSNVDSQWDRYSDDTGITDYSNGGYLIGIYTDTYFYWANPYRTFGDVIVQVDTEKLNGGDDMQYGIICHHTDINNWYVLVVSGDGYAAIRKRYQGNDLEYIADWVQVSSLNTGNASNHLQAECVGDRLSLFVNGEIAIEAFDSDITGGDVGLLAGNFDQNSSEVLFDNYIVQAP